MLFSALSWHICVCIRKPLLEFLFEQNRNLFLAGRNVSRFSDISLEVVEFDLIIIENEVSACVFHCEFGRLNDCFYEKHNWDSENKGQGGSGSFL